MRAFSELSARLPNLETLGEGAFVELSVSRLQSAEVAWLNHRWLLQNGIFSPGRCSEIESWLLEEFAWVVRTPDLPESALSPRSKLVRADRYGGIGVGAHGGSGRSAIFGAFNVKGIGRTPLAAEVQDPFHSSGALTLEEAIREAAFAEICRNEFPFGAVPVLAVIRTGLQVRWESQGREVSQPRALVVRPNFVRPAHFQRAIYFGKTHQEWMPDVSRVHLARAALRGPAFRSGVGADPDEALSFIPRMAEQIAYGVAHRLTHGAYVLSNMTMAGELVDFGGATSLPTWGAAESTRGYSPFGSGMLDEFLVASRELVDALASGRDEAEVNYGRLAADAHAAFGRRLVEELARMSGPFLRPIQSPRGDEATACFVKLLRQQQAIKYASFSATVDPETLGSTKGRRRVCIGSRTLGERHRQHSLREFASTCPRDFDGATLLLAHVSSRQNSLPICRTKRLAWIATANRLLWRYRT